MTKSSKFLVTFYAVLTSLFWFVAAHFLNLVAPMMLNDIAWVNRLLAQAAIALIIYVLLTLWFVGWIISREK